MKVQQQVPAQDGDQHPDRAIRFRVGINVGDVIPDGLDVHGDVVNLAARLQAECPVGGICVSRAVRDHVQDRLDLAFEELGALKLKNIARPVEAFAVRVDVATNPIECSHVHDKHEPLPLPDKPTIAVLAFTNMSGDPEQEYFSDGIAEDIITELARSHSLFVIARNSSFSFKGRAVNLKQVAHELGVRYIVEGSVRRSGNRIRITAQLIDAGTGSHIWAERYDRDLADIFTVQDEITRAMLAAIGPAISQAERHRIMQKPPESLSAWEAYQRALSQWSQFSDPSPSGEFLQRVVTLDPRFAPAHAMLALRYLTETTIGIRPPVEGRRLAEAKARTALELDPDSAIAHATLAWIFSFQGDRAQALEEAETAITLNPNDPQGHMVMGRVLVFSGKHAEAREFLDTASRLDPLGQTAVTVMVHRAIGYYFERDYRGAEAMARRAIRAYPQNPRPYTWLAATLGQLGRADEAQIALNAAIVAPLSYFEFVTRSRPPWYFRPEDYEHLLDGLQKAGWQG
jgi:adenylate cyclase